MAQTQQGSSLTADSWPRPQGPEETLEGFSGWHEIGRGGDATVYRAVQDALGREVAIKVLMVDDEESVRRFTREVQLMVSLGRQHPNIANVLQIGTSSRGRPCIVMDYYELGSLDQRLATYGQLSADEVVNVGTVVADALSFAHGKGVLHRDVKPQNILILPTTYVLSDFGIARLIDAKHTSSSDRFSYRHASPQVLDGAPPAEGDDIWSLGATLFHLLDGKPPFTTTSTEPDSALAYIRRARVEEPRELRRGDVPPALVSIIGRALQKDPALRYHSAAELRDDLSRVGTESRAWGSGVIDIQAPPAMTPGADPASAATWGGVPGKTHPTTDMTSLRLPGTGELQPVAPAPSAPPPTVSGFTPVPIEALPAEEEEPRRPPFLLIGLGGVAIGIIVVLVIALFNQRVPVQDGPIDPGATASSEPSHTVRPNDPLLKPKNLAVQDNQDGTVDVTWDAPEERPNRYVISMRPQGQTSSQVVATPGPTETSRKRIPADTRQGKVCIGVSSEKDGRLGADESCVG